MSKTPPNEFPFLDLIKAYKERWKRDPKTGMLKSPYWQNFYNMFKQWTFNQIVLYWSATLVEEELQKEVFLPEFEGDNPADTPEARAVEIFSQFQTDKFLLYENYLGAFPKNPMIAFEIMRIIIALAIHQHALMRALLAHEIIPNDEMLELELLPQFWDGFLPAFKGIYNEGENSIGVRLNDKYLMKEQIYTQKMKLSQVKALQGTKAQPKFANAKSVVTKKSGRKWKELHLIVEMVKYHTKKGEAGGNWFIKTKWKGGRYKSFKLSELGFAPQKGEPYKSFELLKAFATNGGHLDPQEIYGTVGREVLLKESDKLNQQISRLRKLLNKTFKVDGNPIKYRNGVWSIQFAECSYKVPDVKDPQPSDYIPEDDIGDASATAYRATVPDLENISGIGYGGLADLKKELDLGNERSGIVDEPDPD